MTLKHRLAKLEKAIGLVPAAACPVCHDSPLQGICIYFEEDDGTLRLDSGTPPEPCPVCGKLPTSLGVSRIIFANTEPREEFTEVLD